MTREAMLDKFFSSFGITAFPVTSEPKDTVFPWLTYETSGANFGDEPTDIIVKLWYHTESEAEPNAKVREISERIGMGGKILSYTGGKMWLKRGTPWAVSVPDETDVTVKCKQLNIRVEDWRI